MIGLIKKYFRLASTIYNKLFLFYFPNYRRIRRGLVKYKKTPTVEQYTICQGKGEVHIGENCTFGYKLGGFNRGGSVELQARYSNSKILVGSNVNTNNNVFICAANYIEIGNESLIGQNVTLMDHEAHGIPPSKRREIGEMGSIVIGRNVWIGNNVTILKNTSIGDNSIIAAGALVSGNFPENVIVGGVPAKVIKKING